MRKLRKVLAGILSLCMTVAIANMSTTVTKAATNGYSLNLGTAIWDDDSHTSFKYPHAKIDGVGNDKIYSITVNIENGTAEEISSDLEIPTYGAIGRTYVFNDGKTKDEVEEILKNLEFTSANTGKMNVDIMISSNKTTGFNANNVRDVVYNSVNGHYYMRTGVQGNWLQAYNKSKEYTYQGRKGYMLTCVYGDDEYNFLNGLGNYFTTLPHIGASKLKDGSGNVISDLNEITTSNLTLTRDASTNGIYYNCGPESGQVYTMSTPVNGQGDNQWECILVGNNGQGSGTWDEWYDYEPYHEIIVEFGGYEDNQDPGGYSKDNEVTASDKNFIPMDVEATIGNERYAPLSKALEDAQDGDTIKIVKDQVTAANDATLKEGVTLEGKTGQSFKATTNSVIDVNTNGKLTLKDGKVETSANANLLVEANGTDYDVTVPDSSSTVVAGENDESYVMSESDGVVKIGDINYTYKNPSNDHLAMVYIPDGMYNNEEVTKATVDAGKTGTVKIKDDQTVEVKQASATEEVTVERKNDTVEATVPANATVDAFGHTGINTASGSLTVKPGKDDGRTTVTVKGTTSFTADGHTYTGLQEGDVIPLGKYNVTLNIGNNVTANNQKTEYYYNDQYEVTLQPNQNYDLAKKDVNVKMGGNDVSDSATSKEGDNVKVSLTVKGDIEINADSTRQKTVITFDTDGKGTYTVTNANGENVEVNDNKVEVNRNEELTVKFTPKAKTRSADDSFSILTQLALDGTSVFDQAVLDWDSKGYTYTFTPDKAKQTIKATYTDSHLLKVSVTSGEVSGLDNYVVSPDTKNNTNVKTVIVPDGESVDLTFTADTAANTNHAKLTVNGTKVKKFNGKSYTVKVDEPKEVVVAYTTQPEVTVSVENGTFDQDASDNLWTQVADGYQTTVENDDTTKLVFEANKGYGVDSFMINGQSVKITKNADGKYEYTLENVTAATSVKLVFAKEYTVTFKDQNDVEVGNDTVVENHTISKKEFENAKAKLKADKGYTFFGWKDENGKIYTEETAVTGDTVLKAYFKKGVDNGESKDNQTGLNAIIGANGFTIHVDNVKNLTADNAKDRAEAEAISSKGTMVAKENITVKGLADLQKATKAGTYKLTFEAEDASVTVEVKVQDMTPAVTGKTASTVTIKGEPNTEYTVTNPDGTPALDKNGQPIKGTTDANGKVTFVGLEKGKDYTITSEESGSVKTGTSAVDAEDIANSFRENEKDKAKVTGEGKNEKAENSKVDVVVDENGNYKVILKDDINGTVKVPDTWGDITVDLNGNTIKGNDATDKEPAKPGLDFVKDDTSKGNGTNLVIKDTSKDGTGTIAGGNGSSKYPDGAAGIKGDKDSSTPTVEVEKPVKVIGGNGSTGENGNGGNGGSGIEGNIDTIINGGTVIGGNGGSGTDKDNGDAGTGGNGGNGIDSDNKNVTIKDGEVIGGNGGSGGNSSKGDGGNGGTGGNGITGSKDTEISGGDISGGDGGNGGSTDNGNGGNGGSGGNGTTDSKDTDISGGNIDGGNGGSGGNSDKGNGGSGGNGGNGVDNGKNPGTITGGDINGGNGGSGGNTNDGTGGTGGNGGNGINGTGDITLDGDKKPNGGNGGNGGSSTNGQGGQSGDKGNGTSDGKVPGTGHSGKDGQSGNTGDNKNNSNNGQNSTNSSSKPQVKSNNNAKQGKVKTGDETNSALYMEIVGISFIGLMILLLSRKKEEYKTK